MKAIINNLALLQLLFVLCIISSSFSAAVAGGGGGGGVLRKFAAENDDPGVLNVHVVPHTHDDGRKKKTKNEKRNGILLRNPIIIVLAFFMELLTDRIRCRSHAKYAFLPLVSLCHCVRMTSRTLSPLEALRSCLFLLLFLL
jgi:hypothetical protein